MKLRTVNVLAGMSMLTLASVAGAQTASSTTASAKADVSLEEIVVTARRRAESIEDVPQVINAVTPEALAKFNIQSFQDVASLVPGLTLSNDNSGFRAKAAIRGVNFEVNTATSPTA